MFDWLRRIWRILQKEKFEVRTAPAPKGSEPKTPQPPREYYVEPKPSHIRSKTTHQDMRTCLRCGKPYVILPNGFHMGCLRHFLLRGKIE